MSLKTKIGSVIKYRDNVSYKHLTAIVICESSSKTYSNTQVFEVIKILDELGYVLTIPIENVIKIICH